MVFVHQLVRHHLEIQEILINLSESESCQTKYQEFRDDFFFKYVKEEGLSCFMGKVS